MAEKFDLLVAGAGIAGLSAALEASKQKDCQVAVLDRFDGTQSNTYFAQGGIATAIGKGDSAKKHLGDTLRAGRGLCDEKVARLIIEGGPAAIGELMDLGLEFDGGNKSPELGLEGGHSEHRVLHINGDQTGKGIELFMKKIAGEQKNIRFLGKTYVNEIFVEKKEFIGVGAIGRQTEFAANALVLATGGYAACFEKTTNPKTTIGSGIALGARAGCPLEGMEFVQFHPTTLSGQTQSNFLVTEAVRGEGGKIVDESGRQIVNPLDTRDRVSVSIYRELMLGKKVFVDARGLSGEFFAQRFPMVHKELLKGGINPETGLIPIETAAHYTIGGIKTSITAQAGVGEIYAAGECACSGLHGANRLASNSLLEGLVMGKIAGANASAQKPKSMAMPIDSRKPALPDERDGVPTKTSYEAMRKIMWRCCGVIRDEPNLKDGLAGIRNLEKKIEIRQDIESIAVRNALFVCEKTMEAALARKQSIGVHFRAN